MSFNALMGDVLGALYAALGDPAVVTIGGVPNDILVLPDDDAVYEASDFKTFKAMASDVVGLSEGDTLEVAGAQLTVNNFDDSDDGLEVIIRVFKQ